LQIVVRKQLGLTPIDQPPSWAVKSAPTNIGECAIDKKKSCSPMKKDLYAQMRKELTKLWIVLRTTSEQDAVQQKLLKVNQLALEIGGKVQRDAQRLNGDVDRFLHHELSRMEIDRMFEDALKLEQDTREL
jgi:hypothetical protein